MEYPLIKGNYQSLIFEFRGYKVMIDRDLAQLYGVETRVLVQAVKRNIERFPEDFMFRLTKEEMENWISQIVISNKEKMGLRKLPYVFNEQGVAMLSSVLRSKQAIQVNIDIMRAFAKYRAFLKENEDLRVEIKALDNKFTRAFKFLLEKIDALHQTNKERKPIRFEIPPKKNTKTKKQGRNLRP